VNYAEYKPIPPGQKLVAFISAPVDGHEIPKSVSFVAGQRSVSVTTVQTAICAFKYSIHHLMLTGMIGFD